MAYGARPGSLFEQLLPETQEAITKEWTKMRYDRPGVDLSEARGKTGGEWLAHTAGIDDPGMYALATMFLGGNQGYVGTPRQMAYGVAQNMAGGARGRQSEGGWGKGGELNWPGYRGLNNYMNANDMYAAALHGGTAPGNTYTENLFSQYLYENYRDLWEKERAGGARQWYGNQQGGWWY